MNWRRLSLVPYRVRLLLRATFVFLMVATVGLALSVLQQEKQLSYKNYQINFQKTREQIAATLRHPSGQLALLNPAAGGGAALHPLLLPFAALDFDDLQKVQQAVAMSGCLAQYGDNGSLCVGIGNNPWAGDINKAPGPPRHRQGCAARPGIRVDRTVRGKYGTANATLAFWRHARPADRLHCGRCGTRQGASGKRFSRLDLAEPAL